LDCALAGRVLELPGSDPLMSSSLSVVLMGLLLLVDGQREPRSSATLTPRDPRDLSPVETDPVIQALDKPTARLYRRSAAPADVEMQDGPKSCR
jgi:hypothetical protein